MFQARDGERKQGDDGKRETRVAAGAYKGMQPLERAAGEGVEEWQARRMSSGMRGMRLPAHCEVIDAELAGVLIALRETAQQAGANERKCLIMSDCESAMRMIEGAWWATHRRHGQHSRGASVKTDTARAGGPDGCGRRREWRREHRHASGHARSEQCRRKRAGEGTDIIKIRSKTKAHNEEPRHAKRRNEQRGHRRSSERAAARRAAAQRRREQRGRGVEQRRRRARCCCDLLWEEGVRARELWSSGGE